MHAPVERTSVKTLRVLVLEDSARDAELVIRELQSYGYDLDWSRVDKEEDFRAQIDAGPDLVIVDYTLPQFDAPSALAIMQEKGISTPFIIVSGSITEETAVAALKLGADDFLLKDRLARLGPAVDSALHRQRLREESRHAQLALIEREARLQMAQQIGAIGDWEFDCETRMCSWSAQMFRLFELDPALGAPDLEKLLTYYSPESAQVTWNCARRVMETGGLVELEQHVKLPSGRMAHHASVFVGSKDAQGRVVRLYGTCQDITKRKKQEEERAADARRLAELSRRVVAVEEEERRRLAGELHDRTSPSLSAVALNLQMIAADLPPTAPAALSSRLADTRTLIAETVTDIRDVCADLRSATLDYAGLPLALQGYAEVFSRRTGITVNVSATGPEKRLAADTEALLFRIAQEALTNCAKHAKADAIRIELELGGERTTLAISDKGAGFDLAALGKSGNRPGLGLLTMRERAEFAGGTFSIQSQPGRGTRITVVI